jgi:3-deoxy-manno-octulosonate cytidylyltransferase (CMP-KDO synthetase)
MPSAEPGAVSPSKSSLKAAVVIPARLGSTRFPRKVLARETGKYLLQHVWEGVAGAKAVSRVVIATDSEEVVIAARSFGAEARLTSPSHLSGTDRVAEVARDLPDPFIVNVQGDEPLVRGEDLERIIRLFEEGEEETVMATLAVERRDAEGQRDPHNVKVVCDSIGRALYFSRAAIPCSAVHGGAAHGAGGGAWLHHIGIYGYRREFLLEFARLKPGPLEAVERLEQLRALENGYRIRVAITPHRYQGIDTEEEYREFVRDYRVIEPGGPREGPGRGVR